VKRGHLRHVDGLTNLSADVQSAHIRKEVLMTTESTGKSSGERLQDRIDGLAQAADDLRVIDLEQVHELADALASSSSEMGRSASIRSVELAALEMGVVPTRYLPNLGTIGVSGQVKLLRASVAIVGLGGLGGHVAEALARMGVGHLTLIDGDVFEETNLNRQLLCAEENLGAEKALAARRRAAKVNAAVETVAHAEILTGENLPRLLGGVDVVVDALDRLPTRLMLQEGAQALGIPMVHGSIAGFLGQVATIFPSDLGLRGLYGGLDELPEQGLEAELGTPAPTPMMVAAWQAQEVVKVLTGKGELLRNRLLLIDMESATSQVLDLR
jgi:molybdopterin/thiamine biosynthesis adenylyltransferase